MVVTDEDKMITPVQIKNKLLRKLCIPEGGSCKYIIQRGEMKGEYCSRVCVEDGRCFLHVGRIPPMLFRCEAICRDGCQCDNLTSSKYHKCKRHKKTLAWKK